MFITSTWIPPLFARLLCFKKSTKQLQQLVNENNNALIDNIFIKDLETTKEESKYIIF